MGGKRRYFEVSNNPNSDICNILKEIGEYEKNVNDNIYKYNAYRRAAGILAKQPERIKSGNDAIELYGIGESIADTIDEYLDTGKVKKLERIRKHPKHKAIMELTRVSGIGPVKARTLIKKGIKSVEQLKKHREMLTRQQIIGLKYFEDFEKKIPRNEIQKMERIIDRTIQNLDKYYSITVCGSYRRGKKSSGDIDILLTHERYSSNKMKSPGDYLKNVVIALQEINFVTDTIGLGKVKFMGVCKVGRTGRRIDIRLCPYDEYYCAVLYYTGNDMFNIKMRSHALSKGYTLNEYSLRRILANGKPGRPMKITNEKDIFDIIDFPYIKPEERNL